MTRPSAWAASLVGSAVAVLLVGCTGGKIEAPQAAGTGGSGAGAGSGIGGAVGTGGTVSTGGNVGAGGTGTGGNVGTGGGAGAGVAGSGTSGRGGTTGRGGGSGTGGRTSSGTGGTSGTAASDGGSVMSYDGGSSSNDGPGIFVAVGYGGRRARSLDDGLTWVDDVALESNGGDDKDLLRAATYGNGQYVALGYHVLTSPDGQTWQDYGVNALDQWFGAAVFANGQFVAQGGYGMRVTSPDGLTWTHHDIDTSAAHQADGLAYVPTSSAGASFVAANDNGARSYSRDGSTWTYSTSQTSVATTHVAAGNGLAVAVNDSAQAVVSSDGGATWSSAITIAGNCCTGITFAQGHFTAVGSGGAFTSADGMTWTTHAPSGSFSPYSIVVYGHGTYVVMGNKGPIRSTDLTTWTTGSTMSSSNNFQAIVFAPNP